MTRPVEDGHMGSEDAEFAALVAEQLLPADRLVSALLELSAAQGGVSDIAPVLTELACMVTEVDGAAFELVDGDHVLYVAVTGLLAGSEGTRVARAGSLSGLVIMTAQSQVCIDTANDTRVDRAACERLGIGSMAIVPIRHQNHTIAVLKLASSAAGAITEHQVRCVEPLVQAASARLAQAEAAESAAARLGLLNDVAASSKQVLLSDDPGQVLVEAIQRVVDAAHVWLILPNGTGDLSISRHVGADLGPLTIPRDDTSLAGAAYMSGRAQIVADWTTHPKVSRETVQRLAGAGVIDSRAAVFIPLETPDGPAGVLTVLLREPITASNADLLGLLRLLAAEAGIAITRHELGRQLANQARTDPLTGAANRRVWNERFDHEVTLARRSGQPLTVALLDLDFFKRYNDSFGHPAGDELLRQATVAWAAALRPTDLLARLGGEEFGVLLPDADVDAAVTIMKRLGSAVPFEQTVSIGVTTYRGDDDIATAMHRADEALYAAKSAGRDQVATS